MSLPICNPESPLQPPDCQLSGLDQLSTVIGPSYANITSGLLSIFAALAGVYIVIAGARYVLSTIQPDLVTYNNIDPIEEKEPDPEMLEYRDYIDGDYDRY